MNSTSVYWVRLDNSVVTLLFFSFPGFVMSACLCRYLCCWQLYQLDMLSSLSGTQAKNNIR